MATIRQKKLAKKITENYRNKKVKNKGELLKECDYSEETTKQPSRILESKGIQEELKPFIDQLEKERQRLLNSIKTKDLDKVSYDKAVNSLDTLTKNIQLLSGGATSRDEMTISKEDEKRIKEIFK